MSNCYYLRRTIVFLKGYLPLLFYALKLEKSVDCISVRFLSEIEMGCVLRLAISLNKRFRFEQDERFSIEFVVVDINERLPMCS